MRMLLGISLAAFVCCGSLVTENDQNASPLRASVAKWPDQKEGAVTITYDSPFGVLDSFDFPMAEAIKRNLKMSYELVTDLYDKPGMAAYVQHGLTLYHSGCISFFGHGYTHANHDALSPDSAYQSFKQCYTWMQEKGFCTQTYAYPFGAGCRPETQQTLSRAGFLFGRGVCWDREKMIVCPDNIQEPENWLFLPSVPIAKDLPDHINTPDQVANLLRETEEREGWLILMYHSIGIPSGWGYYPMSSFQQDLDYIASSRLWVDHIENIARYIRERRHAEITLKELPGERFEFSLDDGLDDAVYCRPLTVVFQVAAPKSCSFCEVEASSGFMRRQRAEKGVHRVPIKDGAFSLAVVPDGNKQYLQLQ